MTVINNYTSAILSTKPEEGITYDEFMDPDNDPNDKFDQLYFAIKDLRENLIKNIEYVHECHSNFMKNIHWKLDAKVSKLESMILPIHSIYPKMQNSLNHLESQYFRNDIVNQATNVVKDQMNDFTNTIFRMENELANIRNETKHRMEVSEYKHKQENDRIEKLRNDLDFVMRFTVNKNVTS
jgi:hypothetical protein